LIYFARWTSTVGIFDITLYFQDGGHAVRPPLAAL